MNTKYLLLIGAGATLSDAANKPSKRRPPLDLGFFASTKKLEYTEYYTVERYLQNTYGSVLGFGIPDRLEAVMATIYADINNPEIEESAVVAFRALIRLFCKRLADSTNSMRITNQFNIYRLLARILDNGVKPKEICFVTFNQDIQIEKTLQLLQKTSRSNRFGTIFDFPHCYEIKSLKNILTRPETAVPRFAIGSGTDKTIRILKLHGSLNWFSTHRSQKIPKKSILNTARKLYITPRQTILTDMTIKSKRKQYTCPVIIPPVTHKAGILHQDVIPLWQKAEISLRHAQHVIVFGYSCPTMDFESANLLMRTMKMNNNLKTFSIIDPNPAVIERYADVTGLDSIHYFRSMNAYLKN